MDDFTIISYPGTRNDLLLSLTESRSRYMLPIGGRFRVVDFTVRNSFASGARSTIIYSNLEDDLAAYVDRYGPFGDMKFPPIKVITREYSDIRVCYNLILESNTEYYVIYNGDNPSIIDFTSIIKKYKSKRTGAVLFRLNLEGKPTMAYTVLVSDQKTLLGVVKGAIKEKRSAPNLFEMIINILVNVGISKSSFDAYYWPIKNVPEYYALNREIIWNPEIFSLLYREQIIKSHIATGGYAHVGRLAKIHGSFISDFCKINGTVENSIIYPGVEIGDHAVIRDSIILPYNRIGNGTKITRCVVDERTDLQPESTYLNIGSSCRIGSGEEFIKNTDFPRSLFSSITLIGKDCRIADGARIGGGCYVASGMGEEFQGVKKFLYDGTSLVKMVPEAS
jgi:glucose-1-phosphate adenylyltransferase